MVWRMLVAEKLDLTVCERDIVRTTSMMVRMFDIRNRAVQKQEARDLDRVRLEHGEISRADLRRENDFFAEVDFSRFRIVAVGNRPIEQIR